MVKKFQKIRNTCALRMSIAKKFKTGIEKPCNNLKNVTSKIENTNLNWKI